jgi:hypothetical protein
MDQMNLWLHKYQVLKIKKTITTIALDESIKLLAVAVCMLMFLACSRNPVLRFSNEWSNDVTEMWKSNTSTLYIENLDTTRQGLDVPLFSQSDKYFVLLVSGILPLGSMNIKAVHITDGNREPAAIYPDAVQNDDPKAVLRAFKVYHLSRYERQLSFGGLLYVYHVDPGRYYIFLEKDDKELAGNELTIFTGKK